MTSLSQLLFVIAKKSLLASTSLSCSTFIHVSYAAFLFIYFLNHVIPTRERGKLFGSISSFHSVSSRAMEEEKEVTKEGPLIYFWEMVNKYFEKNSSKNVLKEVKRSSASSF